MSHGKLYRSFIILQEDERGHSVSKDKPLSGYAKIEVKGDSCKVSFYAQNLKKEYANCNMMLICNKKDTKSLINLGNMNITGQGKVESSKEHNSSNIGDTGISYDKIVGAAICKEVAGKLVYMMCGFLNGEQPTNNWKDYSKISCVSKEKEDKKHYVKDTYKKDNADKKYKNDDCDDKKHYDKDDDKEYHNDCDNEKYHNKDNDNDKDNDKDNEKNKYNDDCGCDKKHDKDGECNDKHDYPEKDEKYCGCDDKEENRFSKYEDSIDVSELTRGTDDFEMRGAMAEFFNNVVDGLEQVHMQSEIKNVKWYKVPVSCFDDMCNVCNYNKYTTLHYPMINYYPYIVKKGHFMVGLKCNDKGKVKYVVYGIHGSKNKCDQPYAGKTGFVTFVPMGTSDEGCWLMFYDFRNSMVVVPMK